MVSTFTLSITVLVYLMAVFYLSWYGYKRTREVEDFMVAGRKAHPFVVAISYGSTLISTSAIVGFGGVAGLFGMGLLWLTFVHAKEATALGICKALFGMDTLLTGTWTVVDSILVALPISLVVAFGVSLLTTPMDEAHLDECFRGIEE